MKVPASKIASAALIAPLLCKQTHVPNFFGLFHPRTSLEHHAKSSEICVDLTPFRAKGDAALSECD